MATTTTIHVHPTDPITPGPDVDPCASLDSGHSMKMYFHGGYCEIVLFQFWEIRSISDLILSMFIIMLLSIVFEALRYFREYLLWSQRKDNCCSIKSCKHMQPTPINSTEELTPREHHYKVPLWKKMFQVSHLIQTFLLMIIVTLSFTLMMIFMTFNYYLALAVVLGQGIGYFFVGWRKKTIVTEVQQCH